MAIHRIVLQGGIHFEEKENGKVAKDIIIRLWWIARNTRCRAHCHQYIHR